MINMMPGMSVAEMNVDIPYTAPVVPLDVRKRVRFSEVDVLATYYDEYSNSVNHDEPPHPSVVLPPKKWKVRERRSQASLGTNHTGRYLSIQPGDELVFESRASDAREKEPAQFDVIRLANISASHVAFKVKTTAPEKFRVKPSYGFIECGGTKMVEVTVLPGFVMSTQKDRFLVMSVPLDGELDSHDDLVEYWHDLLNDPKSTAVVDEHKLRCTVVMPINGDASPSTSSAEESRTFVMEQLTALEGKLDLLLAIRTENHKRSAKARENLLTTAMLLVLLFLCTRVIVLLFASDSNYEN
ncbi:motile sperm domain-containing protein 2-like [Paramacrobiotus metropolitanus]|uniref:motile sperm domain-containing protein 2-like n=1 Tax=Paramacrobiotus metropolitanus TaxID=2943436 RepID=UPI0024457C02|nr:motile sperm domain-containing protein 2-like [Paramacrobiotus metropolitanus]